MKTLKKALALVLVCCALLTMSACHGKDEVALTIDGIEIKSGVYLAAMIFADMEARNTVDQTLQEQAQNGASVPAEIDYSEQKIGETPYEDYVKQETLRFCKEYAVLKKLAAEKKITLTHDELATAKYYAQYMWSSYAELMENNGVAYSSFEEYYLYSDTAYQSWGYFTTYKSKYFDSLYNEKGSKEVDKETLTKEMTEHYLLANTLSAKITEKSTDEEIKAEKAKLEKLKERIEKGEEFSKIYYEYNETTKDKYLEEMGYTDDNKPEQKDIFGNIYGDENTQAASADYAELADMKEKEVKILETKSEDGKKVTAINLYVKRDITSDSYYLDKVLKPYLLHELKDTDFNTIISDLVAKVKVDENTWATDRFDPADIEYPETEQTTM